MVIPKEDILVIGVEKLGDIIVDLEGQFIGQQQQWPGSSVWSHLFFPFLTSW